MYFIELIFTKTKQCFLHLPGKTALAHFLAQQEFEQLLQLTPGFDTGWQPPGFAYIAVEHYCVLLRGGIKLRNRIINFCNVGTVECSLQARGGFLLRSGIYRCHRYAQESGQ